MDISMQIILSYHNVFRRSRRESQVRLRRGRTRVTAMFELYFVGPKQRSPYISTLVAPYRDINARFIFVAHSYQRGNDRN